MMSGSAAPCRPSRLPLHQSRPSRLPSQSVISPSPSRGDVSKQNVRHMPIRHKTTQNETNRKSMEYRQGVAGEVSPAGPVAPPHQRRRQPASAVGVIPAAMPGNSHHGDSVVNNEMRYVVRQVSSPACGVRMSALRSAGRHQQQVPLSPTLSNKSSSSASTTTSDRLSAVARHSQEVASRFQSRHTCSSRHDVTTPTLYASTSSVDSVRSADPQHRVSVVHRRSIQPVTTSPSTDSAGDVNRSQSRGNCKPNTSRNMYKFQKSDIRRSIDSSESDDNLSSRSDCVRPSTSRHIPTASETKKLRRRSDCPASTSSRPKGSMSCQSRSSAAPQRQNSRLLRLPEAEVDELSDVRSMSTIASAKSSSSSTGTLTDDADESAAESTTSAADRKHRRRTDQRIRYGAPAVTSVVPPQSSNRRSTNANNIGRVTHPSSRGVSSSSSSELRSPVSQSSRLAQVANNPQNIQRVGNFGVTSRAPVSKQNSRPPIAPPQIPKTRSERDANSEKSRASTTVKDNVVTPARPGYQRSRRQLPSESTPAGHSSSVAVAVGQQRSSASSSAQMDINQNGSRSSHQLPSHCHVQTRQTQTPVVKKLQSTARVSGSVLPSTPPACHVTGSRSSLVCPSPSENSPRSETTRPQSRIPSASHSHDLTRRPANGMHLQTVHISEQNATDCKLINKSARNVTAAVVSYRDTAKSAKVATKTVRSSESQTVDHIDRRNLANCDAPSVSYHSVKTHVLHETRSADFGRDSTQPSIKRPRPAPSKLKRPGSVHAIPATAHGGSVPLPEQKRPVSTVCLPHSSGRQLTEKRSIQKSDSCNGAGNISASTERVISTRKAVNDNVAAEVGDQLAKSYDCILSLSTTLESRKSDEDCRPTLGSTTSLVDMTSPRLVKPYSAINGYSTFGRRMTAPKKYHSTTAIPDFSSEVRTQISFSDSQSAMLSHTRASCLSRLPEVDEFECERTSSTSSIVDTQSPDYSHAGIGGKQQQLTGEAPSMYKSIQQNTHTEHQYRTEYSTFVDAETHPDVSTTSTDKTVKIHYSSKTGQASLSNNNESPLESTKYDRNNTEGNHVRPLDDVCVSTAQSDDLEDKTVVEAAVGFSSSADSYVVTYESENIVMLDREPVIDCLTPEDDVVNAEVCQLYDLPGHSGVTASAADSACSRTLPLSESGYDTWKSSQGSVAVPAKCIESTASGKALNRDTEQDGTLRTFEVRGSAFDTNQAENMISENSANTDSCETSQPACDHFSSSFRAGDNRDRKSSVSRPPDTAEVSGADACDGESARCRDYNAACDVQDSAAQMFSSICEHDGCGGTQPVAARASCAGSTPFVDNGAVSSTLIPPGDSAAVSSGQADLNICFSPLTKQSTDNDLSLRRMVASAEYFEELTPSVDHCHRDNDADANRRPGHSFADSSGQICHLTADNLLRNKSIELNVGKNCLTDVLPVRSHRKISSEASTVQLGDENDSVGQTSPTAPANLFSETESVDPYEMICDNLLESMENDVFEAELSRHSPSSRPVAAAACSVDINSRLNKLSESAHEVEATNELDTSLSHPQNIAVCSSSSNVSGRVYAPPSSVSFSSRQSLSTDTPQSALPERLPVMTLRRVRTNFSVVYRQNQSRSVDEPSAVAGRRQSAAHGESVEVDGNMVSGKIDNGTAGTTARRALAVLASRLEDRNRRQSLTPNATRSKSSPQTVAVGHGPNVVCSTPAVTLSSKVRPTATTSTRQLLRGNKDSNKDSSSAAWNDVHDQSKLQISSAQHAPSSSSALKKPSTFRKLFSTKLTSAVRRTQTKHS